MNERGQDYAGIMGKDADHPPDRPFFRWLLRLFLLLLGLSGLGMIGIALVIRHHEAKVPSTDELRAYSPPQVTRVLAKDGTVLSEEFVERRTVVRLPEVPAHVKLAFLAAEDASFYEHRGLDYPGMLRALWVNLRSTGARQGASTITQQLIKNILLTSDQTYERKIKEVVLARRIEQELTKDEILELYLNYIYFGHGRYGVAEASKFYFGKPVGELTLAEGAVLAAIPKGPSRYSPKDNPVRAVRRRDLVLDQMAEKGFVRPEAAEEAKQTPLKLSLDAETASEIAPEAAAEARRVLAEVVGPAAQKGGYTVVTTIDPALEQKARQSLRESLGAHDARQNHVAPIKKVKKPSYFEGDPTTDKRATYVAEVIGSDDAKNEISVRVGTLRGTVSLEKSARHNPKDLPASDFAEKGAELRVAIVRANPGEPGKFRLALGPEGALVAIDPGTRAIVAMVGSYAGEKGTYDRATSARRQPGSTFKTFVFSDALREKSFTLASMLPTSPEAISGTHKPKNYDKSTGGDPVRLREALARSINVSAQWLGERVGPENVVAWSHEVGITSKLGATPSIALGAYEVTPRELCNAYATFAAGGYYEEPYLVEKIIGPDGREIPLPTRAPKKRVMSEAEAYLVTDMLRSVVERGTGQAARVLARPIAGKTGTSNDSKDAWFAGYSTEMVSVVWTGYDDPIPLGPGESGGKTSLPAFVSFMRAAHQGRVVTDFVAPTGLVRIKIDPKSGLLARDGQEDAIDELFLQGTEPKDVAPEPEPEGTDKPSPEGGEPSAGEVPPPAPSG